EEERVQNSLEELLRDAHLVEVFQKGRTALLHGFMVYPDLGKRFPLSAHLAYLIILCALSRFARASTFPGAILTASVNSATASRIRPSSARTTPRSLWASLFGGSSRIASRK